MSPTLVVIATVWSNQLSSTTFVVLQGKQLFEPSVYTGQGTFWTLGLYGTSNFLNPRFIRGKQLFEPLVYTGQATFWTLGLYGASNFLKHRFIRGKQLFPLNVNWHNGADNFFDLLFIRGRQLFWPNFFRLIRGGQLFGPSFYTGQTTFFTQNFLWWYGAGNFLDLHFIRGGQLFCLKIYWDDTGRATFCSLILYGADNFCIRGGQLFGPSYYTGRRTFFRPKNQIFRPRIPKIIGHSLSLMVNISDYM